MKTSYTNNTKNPVHIGAVTIMPGSTRLVESSYILAKKAKEGRKAHREKSNRSQSWLDVFVKQKQDDEIAQLPDLNDKQFSELIAYYQKNKASKKLASALPEEQARREALKSSETSEDFNLNTQEEINE